MSAILIGKRSNDPFTRVPNETARYNFGKLGPGQVLVYLLSHEQGWETSESRIASALGVGVRSVSSSIKVLMEHGFVERTQTRNGSGDFAATQYIVHDTNQSQVPNRRDAISQERETQERETRERETASYKKTIYKEDKDEEEQRSRAISVSDETLSTETLKQGMSVEVAPEAAPPKTKRNYTEAFEAFWLCYRSGNSKPPGSKYNAAKAWAKMSSGDRRAAHEAVGMYFAENTYTQHAERYLKHRQFENYEGMTIEDVQSQSFEPLPMFKPKTVAGLDSIQRMAAEVFRQQPELGNNDSQIPQITEQSGEQ